MALFLVMYTLNKDKDYTRLKGRLRQMNASPVMESAWLLMREATIAALQADLNGFVDNDDEVTLVEAADITATPNVEAKIAQFWRGQAAGAVTGKPVLRDYLLGRR